MGEIHATRGSRRTKSAYEIVRQASRITNAIETQRRGLSYIWNRNERNARSSALSQRYNRVMNAARNYTSNITASQQGATSGNQMRQRVPRSTYAGY